MKKILLIASDFYDYTQLIIKELNSRGCAVSFYDFRPSKNNFVKWRIKSSAAYAARKHNKYFQKILSQEKNNQYDLILIVSAYSFSREHFVQLRESQPEARAVYFMWDTMKNFPQVAELFDVFNAVYSFDTEDCAKYPELKFAPTFFRPDFAVTDAAVETDFDIWSVFAVYPHRYTTVKALQKYLDSRGIAHRFQLYFSTRLAFWFFKLKYPEFKHAKIKEFSFKVLPPEQTLYMMLRSKAVLDLTAVGQTGLTMRILEALAAGRKIITTNAAIKEYEFFDPRNICVIGDDDFSQITEEFLSYPPAPASEQFLRDYSLQKWVQTVALANLEDAE